jgi:type IV pilus assembly protein PilM
LELSESSLASGSPRNPAQRRVETVGEKCLAPSPSAPNLLRAQSLRDALRHYLEKQQGRKTATALIIPDYAVRMTVLDFEEFPSGEQERLALLRFRLRKSVPFHVDEANVSYSVQLQEAKRIEVLAVAIARPILDEYELLLTDAGLRVGLVMPSCLAALPLYPRMPSGLTLVAKLAGTTLSVLLLDQARVRLARCLDLAAGEMDGAAHTTQESVFDLMQQTVAFAEDQLGERVAQLALCGFGEQTEEVGRIAEVEFSVPYSIVRSKFGTAAQENAGLLGLLERYAA